MTILRKLRGLLLWLAIATASAQDFVPVPPLSAHVIDSINMLDARQRSALDQVLADYETRTGSQVAVLLISKTEPEAIEQYSIRVADAWRLGRKGVDDGAILIVAKDNGKAFRRLRIEAGRGVQGTLTDVQSKRILEDVIAPHFRQNDFYGGLVAGVSALTTVLDQEHLPAPAGRSKHAATAQDDGGFMSVLGVLFFAFMVIASMLSRGRGSRNALNDNGWGRAAGVILGAAIGSGLGRRGGGFGGSGGGSGGGFSGGGGGFDGGGASGDW